MNKAIVGKKLGMTQVFSADGKVTPVTVVLAGPCPVVQVKTVERDGYSAVKVGFDKIRENLLTKPELGQFKKAGVEPCRHLKEFKLDILVGECTFPEKHPKSENGEYWCDVHMDLTSCEDTLDKLYENGTIDDNTKVYLSHIEAKGLNHKELEEYFSSLNKKYSINIAYDGLSIDENY